MRGCMCRLNRFRRIESRKKFRQTGEFLTHELVHGFAVDALSGQPRHRRLHHASHVLRRRRAGFGDRVGDRLIDRRAGSAAAGR